MKLQGKYLLLKAMYGGGAVFWRSLMHALKSEVVEAIAIPLHKKALMYLVSASDIDKDYIPTYSILVAEVENPDFTDWCKNTRYGNECRTIRVEKKKKEVVDDWGWKRKITYLVVRDGEKEMEIYANAYETRLASEAEEEQQLNVSEIHRWT